MLVLADKSQLNAEVELLTALNQRSLFDPHGPNIGSIDPHDGVGYFSFSIPHEDHLRISTFEEELVCENELIGDEAFGFCDIPLQVRLTLFSLGFKNFLRRRLLRSCLTTHRLAESEPWCGNYCQSDQNSTFCD
jgi:hypothetical protein